MIVRLRSTYSERNCRDRADEKASPLRTSVASTDAALPARQSGEASQLRAASQRRAASDGSGVAEGLGGVAGGLRPSRPPARAERAGLARIDASGTGDGPRLKTGAVKCTSILKSWYKCVQADSWGYSHFDRGQMRCTRSHLARAPVDARSGNTSGATDPVNLHRHCDAGRKAVLSPLHSAPTLSIRRSSISQRAA
jgi:hypothetical protein